MTVHEIIQEIKSNLETIHTGLLTSSPEPFEQDKIRSLQEGTIVCEVLEEILSELQNFSYHHSHLVKFFEKEFVELKEYFLRENLIEIIFLEDYLFPDNQMLPLYNEKNEFAPTLIRAYVQTIKDWTSSKIEVHNISQKFINDFELLGPATQKLDCPCQKCFGDFRAKIRKLTYDQSLELINKAEDTLNTQIKNLSAIDASNFIYELQREIELKLKSVRVHLKRHDLQKLELSLKRIMGEKFSFPRPLAIQYSEKIHPNLTKFLTERNLSDDLFEQSEFDRFFQQLGTNLWRSERFILQEFSKLVNSFLRYKREDISSNILQEYLGQFWLYSEARKIHRHIIYHLGPTNSGKTYSAIEALAASKKGCYLAPLRLLAGELFDTLNSKGVACSLLTGEEIIDAPNSTHVASTIEMAQLKESFDCCVIDEIQMLADPQRGWAWTRALINMQAPEIHICGDVSVKELVQNIIQLTGDTMEIKEYERLSELQILNHPIHLASMKKNDALIVFSRRNALKYKRDLEQMDFKVSIVYGRLGPEVRREQARKFDQGETDIIVSTDAIAMGMNLPIKRIVFSSLVKFIDNEEFPISNSEIKQISGRAGRFKRFPVGEVTCLSRVENGIESIEKAIKIELPQSKYAMVGPDLDIFNQVNTALSGHNLPVMGLSEFLRLFNTMEFSSPFYCVDLREMIELSDIVEEANKKYQALTTAEIFGFTCAPVNMGIPEHLQYYIYILNNFIKGKAISFEDINAQSDNIDYLETSIKCVELYQWLARHFSKKNFEYIEEDLLDNKSHAIEKLNKLLSDRFSKHCSSCGVKVSSESSFNICEACFLERKKKFPYHRNPSSHPYKKNYSKKKNHNRRR